MEQKPTPEPKEKLDCPSVPLFIAPQIIIICAIIMLGQASQLNGIILFLSYLAMQAAYGLSMLVYLLVSPSAD